MRIYRSNRSKACPAEVHLRDQHELLNQYIDQIKKRLVAEDNMPYKNYST
jgi:hypothetical protein